MITNNQIKAFDENELAYLYYCCKTEWDSLNMGYEFDFYVMKAFKNNVIDLLLNKYSDKLAEENKSIIVNILNKIEANV